MKIFVASDHAGFELKEKLIPFIRELGYEIEDMGAYEINHDDDYPDYIASAAKAVAESGNMAVVLGGSGQGEAMVANRFPGVRAAVWYGGSEKILTLSRQHNDANVLSIGARFVTTEEAQQAVQTWLSTNFSGDERHMRRLKKIRDLHT